MEAELDVAKKQRFDLPAHQIGVLRGKLGRAREADALTSEDVVACSGVRDAQACLADRLGHWSNVSLSTELDRGHEGAPKFSCDAFRAMIYGLLRGVGWKVKKSGTKKTIKTSPMKDR